MMNMPSSLTIKRLHSSPYFGPHFLEQEMIRLSQFGEMIPLNSSNHQHILTDVLITNTHTNSDQILSQQIDQTKLIIHPNSGYDNFSEEFVKKHSFPIIIGSPIRSQAVAQYILSALFHHFSKVESQKHWDRERKWPRKLLNELKVCLIGHGHIGKILHQNLKPIVKTLTIYDPFEQFNELDIKNADVFILCCGLNKKSRNFLDKNKLNQISSKALIINAARGELINTKDLLNYLDANEDAFAVLDVFENEPCNLYDFHKYKNLITTSHIAGVYQSIDEATIQFECMVLDDFLNLNSLEFRNKYQKMLLSEKLKPQVGLI